MTKFLENVYNGIGPILIIMQLNRYRPTVIGLPQTLEIPLLCNLIIYNVHKAKMTL